MIFYLFFVSLFSSLGFAKEENHSLLMKNLYPLNPGTEYDNRMMKIETSTRSIRATHSTKESTTTNRNKKCVVEWDKDNVVATQLEGTWILNAELTRVLSPYSPSPVSKMK